MQSEQNVLINKFSEVFKVVNPIFKDRTVLSEKYIPLEIVGRDKQIKEIAKNLQPIIESSSPVNMFITGENGTGKTITVSYVWKMLRTGIESIGRNVTVDFIKINCGIRNNDTEVCKELLSFYDISFNPRGNSISSTMQLVWDAINEKAKDLDFYAVLFFFDEVEKLNLKSQRAANANKAQLDLLYQLTRAVETGLIRMSNCVIGIITATNKPHFLENVERSITSAAGFYNLVFPNYKENDLLEILNGRLHAFKPGIITDDLVNYVAKDVADRYRGDARRALDTLLYAGNFALEDGSSIITMDHIKAAGEKITLLENEKLFADNSKHDNYLFISLVLSHKYSTEPNTGLAYSVYVWICNVLDEPPVSYGHFSRTLSLLADKGILESTRGYRGNTRVYTLSDNVKQLLHVMYTEEIKSKIETNIIDLEVLINSKKNQNKDKHNKILGNF
jgi:cell division control protein 6